MKNQIEKKGILTIQIDSISLKMKIISLIEILFHNLKNKLLIFTLFSIRYWSIISTLFDKYSILTLNP